MSDDVKTQLASLGTQVDLGLRHIDKRFDGQDARLVRIEEQVRLTNGRVNELEKINAARMAGTAATLAAEQRARSESPVVTWETAQTWAKFGGWIVAGGMGLLKLMGKL